VEGQSRVPGQIPRLSSLILHTRPEDRALVRMGPKLWGKRARVNARRRRIRVHPDQKGEDPLPRLKLLEHEVNVKKARETRRQKTFWAVLEETN